MKTDEGVQRLTSRQQVGIMNLDLTGTNITQYMGGSSLIFGKQYHDELFISLKKGPPSQEDRLKCINRLSAYFEVFGNICDIYILKSKYHIFGHFVVRFSSESAAKMAYLSVLSDGTMTAW